MTKSIRVENADTSDWKANVKVYDRAYPRGSGPDKLVEVISLAHPTAMTPPHTYITDSRYLVVEEEQRVRKDRRIGLAVAMKDGFDLRVSQRRSK